MHETLKQTEDSINNDLTQLDRHPIHKIRHYSLHIQNTILEEMKVVQSQVKVCSAELCFALLLPLII